MVWRFLERPNGVGPTLNIYMFRPRGVYNVFKLLLFDRRYLRARIGVLVYQLLHPEDPWLTSAAISYLKSNLTKVMVGFEFGSGRSTKWLSHRLKHLVSIEDDATWYERILQQTTGTNVDYRFAGTKHGCEEYVGEILKFPNESFDIVLVDGSCRDHCIAACTAKVKRGGIVVVDNAEMRIDVSPLASFQRIATSNGIWRTDIYVRPNGAASS